MRAVTKKEIRQITVNKVVLELGPEEVDALADVLNYYLEREPADARRDFVVGLLDALASPATEDHSSTSSGDQRDDPNDLAVGLDPKDPTFKSKVLERIFRSFPLPNAATLEEWKAQAVEYVLKIGRATRGPVNLSDEVFFDWLVSSKIIDERGRRLT
jgi:hypothetical protein